MKKQFVLITGANDGIGLATAKAMLEKGFAIIAHARNEDKAKTGVQKLEKGNAGAEIIPVWGDLAHMDQVLRLAEQVKRALPMGNGLDVLINNAGVYEDTRTLTADGFERTMGINHFSHALLTLKLHETLRAASAPRVLMVSAGVHIGASLDFEDLELNKGWSPFGAYAASKLANSLFAAGLAQNKDWDGIWTCSLHPGVIRTKMLVRVFGVGGEPLAEGAKTSVYCATATGLENQNGGFFAHSRPSQGSPLIYNQQKVAEFWDLTLRRLKSYTANSSLS
ncbi:MAG: SDR family NAD(P)-dependent oxidoreductase [Anaerolineae bacterium]|nr:SDR family NAD(P)-dependent oxidoreductase [Anaerolineae bacterium]